MMGANYADHVAKDVGIQGFNKVANIPTLFIDVYKRQNLATANADEPECKSGLSGINKVKINQLREQFPQRIDGIQGCVLDANGCFRPP